MSLDAEIIQVFVMYYNKILNILPLIIYPDENLEKEEEILRPIKFHPIWFLDFNEQNDFEHIDITYNGKVYCARKYKIITKRRNIKQEFNDDNLDTIVIIIVLPKVLDIYGLNFLSVVSEAILSENIDSFYKIIESEIFKKNVIQTPTIKNLIKSGDSLKMEINGILKNIWDDYFQKVVTHYQHLNLLYSSVHT
ncbi:MAG: hypothetical protein ACFFCV_12395 [Promethearchaeota archaeon]